MSKLPASQLSPWYQCTGDARPDPKDVFNDALHLFSTELSSDPAKLAWITDSKHGNMKEVLSAVSDAQAEYDKKLDKESSKIKRALLSFTEKVTFYGNIIDVLVQHHPECTALAWGAMKFLFVGVVNHRKILTRLSEGLVQIADVLPKAGLVLQLYPVPHIRELVVKIYGHIIKFLLRTLAWYQESRLMRAVHSITRPTELRYDDILAQISSSSHTMYDWACMSGHTEQRDMHLAIRDQAHGQQTLQLSMDQMMIIVQEIRDSMMTEFVLSPAARVDTRQRLSDLQLHQFQSHIAVARLAEPVKALQTAQHLANRRQAKPSANGPAFWLDSKIQRWNSSNEPSLIMVTSTRKTRFWIKDFCARSISLLRQDNIPVLWVLNTVDIFDGEQQDVSTIEVIKYLTTQAMAVNDQTRTDADLTDRLGSCSHATTEREWMNILASILGKLQFLYIIIDVEVVNCASSDSTSRPWPAIFEELFSELSARGSATIVRVALMGYGTPLLSGPLSRSMEDCSVAIGRERQTRSVLARRPHGRRAMTGDGDQQSTLRLGDVKASWQRRKR